MLMFLAGAASISLISGAAFLFLLWRARDETEIWPSHTVRHEVRTQKIRSHAG